MNPSWKQWKTEMWKNSSCQGNISWESSLGCKWTLAISISVENGCQSSRGDRKITSVGIHIKWSDLKEIRCSTQPTAKFYQVRW